MKRLILSGMVCLTSFVNGLAEEPLAAGLVVEFSSRKEPLSDFRIDRRPALLVEKGDSPTSLLPPGPFEATWRGVLRLNKRERLYFSFEGFGKASLLIDEEVVLKADGEDLSKFESERLRLNGGDHLLEIRYASDESGAGRVRMFWKGRDFVRETIPPTSYGHFLAKENNLPVAHASSVRKGRFLAATHGCVRCHHPAMPLDPVTAMPEVFSQAPSLLGVGSRLDEVWMTHWIHTPHKIRPSSRMPALVDSIEDAAHISRYLAELKMDRPKHPAPVGNAIKGGALFAELGCISCHSINKENAREDADRLSLLGVGAKFLPGALAGFLRAPGQHYPWTRMPDFKLLPAESADLAAFLRDLAQLLPRVATISGDLVKGKELFVARNCAACHESPIKDTRKAPNFSTLAENTEKGCMANAPEGPRFGFSLTERQELTSFLRTGGESLHQHNLQEFASRQFNELRCMACHERDGEDSQWDSFAEEVGAWKYKESDPAVVEDHPEKAHRANSTPPSLTFAGEKLHREWTSSFLAGKIKGKPRPWMLGQMPAFSRRSELLAEGLARACGISKQEPGAEALKEPEMMKKIGAQIANVLCLACHGIGSRPPIAVFEGQGINLLLSRQRLRKEYYLRWMLNPYRINPATIMPKFADEEGRTGLIDILEGDAKNQFDAIWWHLDALPTE